MTDPKSSSHDAGAERMATPQAGSSAEPRPRIGPPLGRQTSLAAPDEQLERWGIPTDPAIPGDYIVELNLQYRGALDDAAKRFVELYAEVIEDPGRTPVRVSQTYFSCKISRDEQGVLVQKDKAVSQPYRSIYRIWPDFEVRPLIDRSVSTVKADAARRAYAAMGHNIAWAVIDSGVQASHPHFQLYRNLMHDDVKALHRDFTTPGEPALGRALQDDYGHGTHIAGIIAGGLPTPTNDEQPPVLVFEKVADSDSDGRTTISTYEPRTIDDPALLTGVAPACRLVSLKVLDAAGRGRASNVMRALQYIREQVNADPKLLRIHGVNISAGYEFNAEVFACGQSPLCVEVDRLVRAGVVVVVAAGNTGYGQIMAQDRPGARTGLTDTINDPGNADLAITVGATHRFMPHTYGVSYFSSKGPTADGRLKPDLVAPGERITSCAVGSWRQDIQTVLAVQAGANASPTPIPDDAPTYVDNSGTSMAAPHVSGAIAAFLSIRQEFVQRPDQVKRIFLDSATTLGRERYFEGHGLLDLMRAIQSV